MTLREISGVQDPVVKYARKRGWLAWKMAIEGTKGHPDFIFRRKGIELIVEFKRPDGELEMSQVLRRRDLANAGFTVHVIDNAEDGYALFDQYE